MQMPFLLDACVVLYSRILSITTSLNVIDGIYAVKRRSRLHILYYSLSILTLYSKNEKKSVVRRWKRRVQLSWHLHIVVKR